MGARHPCATKTSSRLHNPWLGTASTKREHRAGDRTACSQDGSKRNSQTDFEFYHVTVCSLTETKMLVSEFSDLDDDKVSLIHTMYDIVGRYV